MKKIIIINSIVLLVLLIFISTVVIFAKVKLEEQKNIKINNEIEKDNQIKKKGKTDFVSENNIEEIKDENKTDDKQDIVDEENSLWCKEDGFDCYKKKDNSIYYCGLLGCGVNDLATEELKDADFDSFSVIGYKYIAQDKNNTYIFGDRNKEKIYLDEETLKILAEEVGGMSTMGYHASYLSDKNNIYFIGRYIPKEGMYESGSYIKVVSSDTKNFEAIDTLRHYVYEGALSEIISVDKNFVYFNGEKLEGADPATFSRKFDLVYVGTIFTDENNVYFNSKKLEGADPNTFEKRNNLGGVFMDKNYIYLSGVFTDDNNIYADFRKLEGADSKNIIYLDTINKEVHGPDIRRRYFIVLMDDNYIYFNIEEKYLFNNNKYKKEDVLKCFEYKHEDEGEECLYDEECRKNLNLSFEKVKNCLKEFE